MHFRDLNLIGDVSRAALNRRVVGDNPYGITGLDIVLLQGVGLSVDTSTGDLFPLDRSLRVGVERAIAALGEHEESSSIPGYVQGATAAYQHVLRLLGETESE